MKTKGILIVLPTAALFFFVLLLAIAVGSISIPFSHVVSYLLYHVPFVDRFVTPNWSQTEEVILSHIRIPRTLLGFIVGASLSVAGVGYQGVLRNPLADPYTLGVSAGASVGAASVIGLGIEGNALGLFAVPVAAFLGACAALWIVLTLGRIGPTLRMEILILAGVVVNALFGAVLTLILWLTPGNAAQQIIWWMIGSLSLRDWHYTWISLPLLLVAWMWIFSYSRDLNALALEDLQAKSLGIRVERTKWTLLIISSLLAASAVAVSGIIGFVGLVVPHMIRLIFGADHRTLVILAGIGGGIFLVLCDLIARVIVSPVELSVGVVTALLGAPFFAYLLRARKQGGIL
jgi:iron complex transport system permease protein